MTSTTLEPDRGGAQAPVPATARPATGQAGARAGGETHGPDASGPRTDRRDRFRRANALVAFVSSCAVMAGNITYLATTPDEPNRLLLWGLQASAVAIGAGVVLLATRWRPSRWLMHAWTSSQILIVVAGAGADGGLHSPFLAILVVPLALTALALHARAMVGHTATAIAGIVVIGFATETLSIGVVAIWAVSLISLVFIGLRVADNARQLTRQVELANAELIERARRDPLTGCFNHRAFYEELDRAVAGADRTGSTTAVVVLDVDHFKRINDEFGHQTGDDTLIAIAEALRSASRASDLVGRTGGEEFAVLLPDADLEDARLAAERLRRAVADADSPVRVTVSLGASMYPTHGTTSSRLMHVADTAMYQAKAAGRDQVKLPA